MKRLLLIIILSAAVGVMFADQVQVLQEGTTCGHVVLDGTTLTAVPNDGYEFVQWEDNSTSPTRIVTPAENKASATPMYAVFARTADIHHNEGDVQISLTDGASGTMNFTVEQCDDYSPFTAWSNENHATSISYTESLGHVYPIFKHSTEDVTPATYGTINIEKVQCGYQLTAVPAAGYAFYQWSDDAEALATRVVSLAAGEYKAEFGAANFKVGDDYFINFADALAAGNNIELLADMVDLDIVIADGQDITLTGNSHSINDLTIANGGKLTLVNDITIQNLYLSTTTGISSQLVGAENLTYSNAYVDITLDPTQAVADDSKWYMIGVPFDVNVNGGILNASTMEAGGQEQDIIVWEYNSALRASTGNGWQLVGVNAQLHAGQCYMFGVESTQNTWRFAKADNAPLVEQTSIALVGHTAADNKDANWNSVANTTLHYANLSSSEVSVAQSYVNTDAEEHYVVRAFSEFSAVLAAPFFVQSAEGTLELTDATHSQLFAPQRAEDNQFYRVEIGNVHQDEFVREDVVYLSINEQGRNMFTAGKDVVKMMGSKLYTYLYTEAYGQKLCAQEVVPQDNVAEYRLVVKAPRQGNYVLRASESEQPLYLLQDGITIAKLNDGDYSLSLSEGIHVFTLRIGESKHVTTSLQDVYQHQQGAKKVLYQNHLYIVRDGKVYSSQGAMMQ